MFEICSLEDARLKVLSLSRVKCANFNYKFFETKLHFETKEVVDLNFHISFFLYICSCNKAYLRSI